MQLLWTRRPIPSKNVTEYMIASERTADCKLFQLLPTIVNESRDNEPLASTFVWCRGYPHDSGAKTIKGLEMYLNRILRSLT